MLDANRVQIVDHARQENAFRTKTNNSNQQTSDFGQKFWCEIETAFDAGAEEEEESGVEGDAPQGGRRQHFAPRVDLPKPKRGENSPHGGAPKCLRTDDDMSQAAS